MDGSLRLARANPQAHVPVSPMSPKRIALATHEMKATSNPATWEADSEAIIITDVGQSHSVMSSSLLTQAVLGCCVELTYVQTHHSVKAQTNPAALNAKLILLFMGSKGNEGL